MRISVNGDPREIRTAGNVAALVAELGLEPSMVLVEHNGTALRRTEWASAALSDGDRIEILQVAAGG
jgi:thiamine biosynthesis protein ThiS